MGEIATLTDSVIKIFGPWINAATIERRVSHRIECTNANKSREEGCYRLEFQTFCTIRPEKSGLTPHFSACPNKFAVAQLDPM